jgi:hypothetical protein
MALYLGQLLPQNSQKPNYETHHPPYGTFVQREATRMTLILLIKSNSQTIDSAVVGALYIKQEYLGA